MHFYSAWKLIAIALTGAFGILGLLTEFKTKDTSRITKWGWISFLGIGLSTMGGIAAQLQETKTTAEESGKQQVRLLAPLGDLQVSIQFRVACNPFVWYHDMCDSPTAQPVDFGKLEATLMFFTDPKKAQECMDKKPCVDDLYLQVAGNSTALLHEGDQLRVSAEHMTVSKRNVPLDGIRSVMDLPGSSVILIVSHGPNRLGPVASLNVDLSLNDGTEFRLFGPFDTATPEKFQTYYRSVLPSWKSSKGN
jgi:hypothetical protein